MDNSNPPAYINLSWSPVVAVNQGLLYPLSGLMSCTCGVSRVPWFHYPIIYDIRARPKLLTSPTGSKDLQMVNIGLRVLFRPNKLNLQTLYRRLGLDYDDRVLPSICNEVR